MIRASSSPDQTHGMWDDSVMSTLNSSTDLSTHKIERLRHLGPVTEKLNGDLFHA